MGSGEIIETQHTERKLIDFDTRRGSLNAQSQVGQPKNSNRSRLSSQRQTRFGTQKID